MVADLPELDHQVTELLGLAAFYVGRLFVDHAAVHQLLPGRQLDLDDALALLRELGLYFSLDASQQERP